MLRLAESPPAIAAEQILPGLEIIRGGVNTVLFWRNKKALLIDSGDLTAVPRGGTADWLLFTHHHPDQCSGAPAFAAAGAKVVVPAAERRFFEDAQEVWDSADGRLDHDY